MDTLLQVAGLGLIAVLLGLVLKKGNGVLALLLTLAACAAMTVSIVRLAEPVVSFLSELRQLDWSLHCCSRCCARSASAF